MHRITSKSPASALTMSCCSMPCARPADSHILRCVPCVTRYRRDQSPGPSPHQLHSLRSHRLWSERHSVASPQARAHARVGGALGAWAAAGAEQRGAAGAHSGAHWAEEEGGQQDGVHGELYAVSSTLPATAVQRAVSAATSTAAASVAARPQLVGPRSMVAASELSEGSDDSLPAPRAFTSKRAVSGKPSHTAHTSQPSAASGAGDAARTSRLVSRSQSQATHNSRLTDAGGAPSAQWDERASVAASNVAGGVDVGSLRSHRLWRDRTSSASPGARAAARVDSALGDWAAVGTQLRGSSEVVGSQGGGSEDEAGTAAGAAGMQGRGDSGGERSSEDDVPLARPAAARALGFRGRSSTDVVGVVPAEASARRRPGRTHSSPSGVPVSLAAPLAHPWHTSAATAATKHTVAAATCARTTAVRTMSQVFLASSAAAEAIAMTATTEEGGKGATSACDVSPTLVRSLQRAYTHSPGTTVPPPSSAFVTPAPRVGSAGGKPAAGTPAQAVGSVVYALTQGAGGEVVLTPVVLPHGAALQQVGDGGAAAAAAVSVVGAGRRASNRPTAGAGAAGPAARASTPTPTQPPAHSRESSLSPGRGTLSHAQRAVPEMRAGVDLGTANTYLTDSTVAAAAQHDVWTASAWAATAGGAGATQLTSSSPGRQSRRVTALNCSPPRAPRYSSPPGAGDGSPPPVQPPDARVAREDVGLLPGLALEAVGDTGAGSPSESSLQAALIQTTLAGGYSSGKRQLFMGTLSAASAGGGASPGALAAVGTAFDAGAGMSPSSTQSAAQDYLPPITHITEDLGEMLVRLQLLGAHHTPGSAAQSPSHSASVSPPRLVGAGTGRHSPRPVGAAAWQMASASSQGVGATAAWSRHSSRAASPSHAGLGAHPRTPSPSRTSPPPFLPTTRGLIRDITALTARISALHVPSASSSPAAARATSAPPNPSSPPRPQAPSMGLMSALSQAASPTSLKRTSSPSYITNLQRAALSPRGPTGSVLPGPRHTSPPSRPTTAALCPARASPVAGGSDSFGAVSSRNNTYVSQTAQLAASFEAAVSSSPARTPGSRYAAVAAASPAASPARAGGVLGLDARVAAAVSAARASASTVAAVLGSSSARTSQLSPAAKPAAAVLRTQPGTEAVLSAPMAPTPAPARTAGSSSSAAVVAPAGGSATPARSGSHASGAPQRAATPTRMRLASLLAAMGVAPGPGPEQQTPPATAAPAPVVDAPVRSAAVSLPPTAETLMSSTPATPAASVALPVSGAGTSPQELQVWWGLGVVHVQLLAVQRFLLKTPSESCAFVDPRLCDLSMAALLCGSAWSYRNGFPHAGSDLIRRRG